ncbi:MAG TPA: pitrilysin family protein [Bacteroidota bacterium]|nr:pitrilysin family protein [Bacteroidota bacterium]
MNRPPARAAARAVAEFEQYTLPNGLTVILHQDRSSRAAALVVMYHVGSKNEKPGRTGFAHLFEHMMFKGSANVPDGDHFRLLQEIGAAINGSTTEDRTNYYEVVPSNYLELALYLEADRMGFLLPAMSQAKLDNQRDVVKNERRQNYDNQPYGTAHETLSRALYPPTHPYHWPVIGSMEDLTAASLEDVKEFFRTFYGPGNACVAVAGDFEPDQVKTWVERYFGPLPRGAEISRPDPAPPVLEGDIALVIEDRVQLPRLFLSYHGAPRGTRQEAILDVLTTILTSGKNSPLYRALILERQLAQHVVAYSDAREIAGTVTIDITGATARPLTEIARLLDELLSDLLDHGVSQREIQAAVNSTEVRLVNRLTTALGKANGLATAYSLSGDTESFNREMERFTDITPEEVLSVAREVFGRHRISLCVVPQGKSSLADLGPGRNARGNGTRSQAAHQSNTGSR